MFPPWEVVEGLLCLNYGDPYPALTPHCADITWQSKGSNGPHVSKVDRETDES